MNYYLLLKLVHLVAVIIFLGNIYTGLFWMFQAHRTKNVAIIHHTMKSLIVSDKYFTTPGVIILTVGGFVAAIQGGIPLLRTGWIFWPILLLTLSGIVFIWKLVPLQRKICNYTATQINDEPFSWPVYNRLYKSWDIWGVIAIITPIIALVMMVMKWPTQSIIK